MPAPRGVALAAWFLGGALVVRSDKECGSPPSQNTLAGPVEWDECMEVRAVLVFNLQDGPALSNNKGTEGASCEAGSNFSPSLTETIMCPLGWNCVLDTAGSVQACRNGLFCETTANKCEQCAGCYSNSDAKIADGGAMPPICGNCKTRFYPAVDEYAAFRLLDSCSQYSASDCGSTDGNCDCNNVMGCHDNGDGGCRPGPVASDDSLEMTNPIGTTVDSNVVFVANQEFMLEMGMESVNFGMVRSPIVIYRDEQFSISAMYAMISMKEGYPRKIAWEQTAEVYTACAPSVKRKLSASNNRSTIRATCSETGAADPKVCDYTTPGKMYDGTDCGFSTLAGYVKEGKLQGMFWPPTSTSTDENIKRERANDCTQFMCASVIEPSTAVAPIQIFVTWKGTDSTDRLMSSGGLSYESFRQYSAFEAFSSAKEKMNSVPSPLNIFHYLPYE
jgi:hypothetical protein